MSKGLFDIYQRSLPKLDFGKLKKLRGLKWVWYTTDMPTLSIQQRLMKEGFVVLPRKEYLEYEDFLRAKQQQNNNNDIVVKRDKSFKVPKRHEKFYDDLDKDLTESLREYRKGKFVGPFDNIKDLLNSLHSKK